MSQREMPYILAEIGFNHGGCIDTAERIITAAASSGVHAVKFQTYRTMDIAIPDSKHYKNICMGEMDLKQHVKVLPIGRQPYPVGIVEVFN